MKHFLSINDVENPLKLADLGLKIKKNPFSLNELGRNKVLGMVFFNPSLRTRMSTARAAYNLGLKVITLNVSQDSWQLETEEGTVMDKGNVEHIKEAAQVMGSYCEILGVRSFPTLNNREKDYSETLINAFVRYSGTPIVSLESASAHPLQSLADLMTIREYSLAKRPKVVLTWAPHIKPLPQAVPNSFARWMQRSDVEFYITHPKGMELNHDFVGSSKVIYNQEEALSGADFVYVKNWSSFNNYGEVLDDRKWTIDLKKMSLTNNAKLMHCLPVRRNLVITDDALDSSHSIIQEQAKNRIFSAQAVLQSILEQS